MEQAILTNANSYHELTHYLHSLKIRRLLLVCDSAISYLHIDTYIKQLPNLAHIDVFRFSDFQPNPLYESVVKGVHFYHEHQCEAIMAIGGGSAIDVAKCIKLYCHMDPEVNYLKQTVVPNDIPFIVMPTTAGTGSEATRYAVIYYEGEKQSVTHESCIPNAVIMDSSVLTTLPLYQKKSTMLDALCHAIESWWSINSTNESKQFSRQAIEMIIENRCSYLNNDEAANQNMLKAAHIAGKAINITQTTAGHAMCYKLTSLFGIAHGHAAALCVSCLFPYMIKHVNLCIDSRGAEYLNTTFHEIALAMGTANTDEAVELFNTIVLKELALSRPKASQSEIKALTASVNPVRLKNNPILLTEESIADLYKRMLVLID